MTKITLPHDPEEHYRTNPRLQGRYDDVLVTNGVPPFNSLLECNSSRFEPTAVAGAVIERPDIATIVQKDIESRVVKGEKEYGERLKPHNGRRALQDLYEELLDAAMYIRQEIYERYGE